MTNYAREDTDVSQLLLGDNYTKKKVEINSGEVIIKGMLLGIITIGGKINQAKSGATDGSQIPVYIAISDVDASGGDVVTEVLAWGRVNTEKLVFDGTDSLNTKVSDVTMYNHLRVHGILALDSTLINDLDNS